MDLFTIVGACVRRWYVTLPLLLVGAGFAFYAYDSVPSLYSSSLSIVVLPSTATVAPAAADAPLVPDNPYSGSGGAKFAAAVLSQNINSSPYRSRIGLTSDDEVTFLATVDKDQPIIHIAATGPTVDVVLSTLNAVTQEAGTVLSEFQTAAGAPSIKQFRIAGAVPVDQVTDVTPSRMRSAGAIFVLGGLVAVLVATVVDAFARRRRERSAADAPSEDDGESPSPRDPTERQAAAEERDVDAGPETSDESAGVRDGRQQARPDDIARQDEVVGA